MQEGLTSNILQKVPLYPCRRVPAVCTMHHGEPLGDPVATAGQLTLAANLGRRGLVDAYIFGGTRSGLLRRSKQKVSGQWVAVALAIAERPNMSIDENELRQALLRIKEARASGSGSEWEIQNQSIEDAITSIRHINRSVGANFKFADELKA